MEAIKEAIARHKAGGSSSVLSTQGAPAGATPTGGPSTPTVQPPSSPAPQTTSPGTMPQAPARPAPGPQAPTGRPQMKQVANFDDETRTLAKALITKLMGAI